MLDFSSLQFHLHSGGPLACSVCAHFITNLILLSSKLQPFVPCQSESLNKQFGIVWKRKCLQNSQSLSLHRKQDLSSALFQMPNFQPGKGQTCCKPHAIPCYLTASKELKHLSFKYCFGLPPFLPLLLSFASLLSFQAVTLTEKVGLHLLARFLPIRHCAGVKPFETAPLLGSCCKPFLLHLPCSSHNQRRIFTSLSHMCFSTMD